MIPIAILHEMEWNAHFGDFISFHISTIAPFRVVLLAFFGEREFRRNKHDGTEIYIRISHIEITCYPPCFCVSLSLPIRILCTSTGESRIFIFMHFYEE